MTRVALVSCVYLQARGNVVTIPLEGMGIGQQLHALKEFQAGRGLQ